MAATKGLVASRAEGAAIGHGRLSLGALRLRELLRGATVRETTGPTRHGAYDTIRPADGEHRHPRIRALRRQGTDWVAARTNQRIRDLLSPDLVPPTTSMIVTNTVWFRGEWRTPFEERNTTTQPFRLADGTETPVSLMRDQWRGGVPYAAFGGDGTWFRTPDDLSADEGTPMPATYPDERGFQMIELPYKGDTLSMLLLVPLAHDGLARLEQLLTADRLRAWTARLKERTADVALPRFRLDGTYELADALKTAGMRRAFVSPDQPGGAQFGGISSSRDPREQLFVASVRHRSFVEVTEKGTEAAAATAMMLAVGAAVPRTRPFHPVVHADRPFLFVIRDVETGAVLFLGRHVDPRR
jgi:serpin B